MCHDRLGLSCVQTEKRYNPTCKTTNYPSFLVVSPSSVTVFTDLRDMDGCEGEGVLLREE